MFLEEHEQSNLRLHDRAFLCSSLFHLVYHGKYGYNAVAKGGRGGRGNIRFATPRNPAPEVAENGEPGEDKILLLELRVLADVGLVGFPSVGKSTLLSVVSNARPKIGAYHFTTITLLGYVVWQSEYFHDRRDRL